MSLTFSGENTLRCLALATIDKPLAKEKMDLETRDVTKYEVGFGAFINVQDSRVRPKKYRLPMVSVPRMI